MVPGTSVFLSSETGMSGNFEIASRVQVPFHTSRQKVGLLLSRCSGQGPHLALMGYHVDFLEFRQDSRVTMSNSGFQLYWPREVQTSIRFAREFFYLPDPSEGAQSLLTEVESDCEKEMSAS